MQQDIPTLLELPHDLLASLSRLGSFGNRRTDVI